MKPRLNSVIGGLLIIFSALMTVVVYSEFTHLISTSTVDLVALTLIWFSLCFPELALGLGVLLGKDSSKLEAQEDDEIPVLIAQNVIQTEENTIIICPHCEFAFPDSSLASERATCPNCAHLVVPMV